MPQPVHVTISAGETGPWRIERVSEVTGPGLARAPRLLVRDGVLDRPAEAVWSVRGFTSNTRYVTTQEKAELVGAASPLGRPRACLAALIPIRKTAGWWELAPDRRRMIMEESSRHISIGMEYMPAIARRLLHARDLGEPFDFLTWFEYAPEDADAFEELVCRLRATEEWSYVDREVDVRLRAEAGHEVR